MAAGCAVAGRVGGGADEDELLPQALLSYRNRGGPKKAIVAVQHAILTAVWHMFAPGLLAPSACATVESREATVQSLGRLSRNLRIRPVVSWRLLEGPHATCNSALEGFSVPGSNSAVSRAKRI